MLYLQYVCNVDMDSPVSLIALGPCCYEPFDRVIAAHAGYHKLLRKIPRPRDSLRRRPPVASSVRDTLRPNIYNMSATSKIYTPTIHTHAFTPIPSRHGLRKKGRWQLCSRLTIPLHKSPNEYFPAMDTLSLGNKSTAESRSRMDEWDSDIRLPWIL